MSRGRYAVEFLIKYRVLVEDVPTVVSAREQATRFMTQNYPQHVLSSIEKLPDEADEAAAPVSA